MSHLQRRTLLHGLGAATVFGALGSTPAVAQTVSGSDIDDFESVLSVLPATVHGDWLTVSVTDIDGLRQVNDPYGNHGYLPGIAAFDIDREEIGVAATVMTRSDDDDHSQLTVIDGEVDLASETDSATTDGGVDYERHAPETDSEGQQYGSLEEPVAAVRGGVTIITGDEDLLSAAVDAAAGESDRLVDQHESVTEGLDTFESAHSRTYRTTETFEITDEAELRYQVMAQTVVDPDTIEQQFGFVFESESAVTDTLVDDVSEQFDDMSAPERSVETDGALVVVTMVRDLEAEREAREHESPSGLRHDREAFDPDDDEITLTVSRGDPTPVDELELTLNDEVYDPEIWADGQEELEAGDTITIEMEEVEPNLSVRLTHDQEYGSSSTGTTILNHFDFELSYDDEGSMSVTYNDSYPLDGDQVALAVYDDQEELWGQPDETPEPVTTAEPWSDELSSGDSAAIDPVEPGDVVIVGWDGVGPRDALVTHHVSPPGELSVDYEFADRTAIVELTVEEDEPADAYELRVDDEPAATQWDDDAETLSGEISITLEDVEPGSRLSVVWGDEAVDVGSRFVYPEIELAVEETTVEHDGGDSVAADELTLYGYTDDGDQTEFPLDEEIDGDFEEGDTVDLDLDSVDHVQLRYDDRYPVAHASTDE